MVDSKVIEAFDMMWGSFPVPVRLIHKNKTVIAVNDAARDRGFKPGVHCFEVGTPEQHKACKAPEALSTNKAVQAVNAEKDTIRYWLPVKGYADVYVHFPLKLSTILG
jgi:hypothetical protein